MAPFCNLKVKIFFNLLGTYKEVRQVADIITTKALRRNSSLFTFPTMSLISTSKKKLRVSSRIM